MKRVFLNFLICLFVIFVYFFIFSPVEAQTYTPTPPPNAFQTATPSFVSTTGGPRYSACDLCGYCPPNPPPQSWGDCQKCLYPGISSDPTTMESLAVDPTTNLPITPVPGRQYTFLGCLTTGGNGSFEQGGAGGVVQSLLRIIFSVVGGVAFLYLIYGSFVILTSQNEPEKLNYGKRIIYGAIIGLIFSLTSILIVNLVANQILQIPGFGSASP